MWLLEESDLQRETKDKSLIQIPIFQSIERTALLCFGCLLSLLEFQFTLPFSHCVLFAYSLDTDKTFVQVHTKYWVQGFCFSFSFVLFFKSRSCIYIRKIPNFNQSLHTNWTLFVIFILFLFIGRSGKGYVIYRILISVWTYQQWIILDYSDVWNLVFLCGTENDMLTIMRSWIDLECWG